MVTEATTGEEQSVDVTNHGVIPEGGVTLNGVYPVAVCCSYCQDARRKRGFDDTDGTDLAYGYRSVHYETGEVSWTLAPMVRPSSRSSSMVKHRPGPPTKPLEGEAPRIRLKCTRAAHRVESVTPVRLAGLLERAYQAGYDHFHLSR